MGTERKFIYHVSGRFDWLKIVIYRLKECWSFSILIFFPWKRSGDVLVVHNYCSKYQLQSITDNFVQLLELRNDEVSTISVLGVTRMRRIIGFICSPVVFLLPNEVLVELAKLKLRRDFRRGSPTEVVLFCDSHLAGWAFGSAVSALNVPLGTLQHGLYRRNDAGSKMAFQNFISDKIYLWDWATYEEFECLGYKDRLQVVGQYKHPNLASKKYMEVDNSLVIICPPYDKASLVFFIGLSEVLQNWVNVKFSLHPKLARSSGLESCNLSSMDAIPRLAVCGDSGVIVDCLVLGIPVVSVGVRRLCSQHLDIENIKNISKEAFRRIQEDASLNLDIDQKRFGVIAN